MADRNPQSQDKYIVRMPDGMRERIRSEAEKSGRSMNAEIIQRLEFALTEDLWERERFVNLLNLKQHTIDKMMHMLYENIGKQRALDDQAKYERSLRQASQQSLLLLCAAITSNDGAPPELVELARTVLKIDTSPETLDTEEEDKAELRKRVGDRDYAAADWEEKLSAEEREILRESRQFSKPIE
ncbi:Arc family DNA-binding protein [Rhizobium johnstonii]